MMKRLHLSILLLFAGLAAAEAQDRIHTTYGEVIECRITEWDREDGSVVYYTPDWDLPRIIVKEGVDYIVAGGRKMVYNHHGRLAEINVRQPVEAPGTEHLFGVAGGWTNTFWSAGVSYTYCFSPRSGVGAQLLYARDNERMGIQGVQFLPHYESRTYIQRMGGFFVLQPSVGLNYYVSDAIFTFRNSWGVERRELHTLGTLSLSLGVQLGFDIRLARGLYLGLAARLHWEPWATDVSDAPNGLFFHPHHGYGFSAGLRFGRER